MKIPRYLLILGSLLFFFLSNTFSQNIKRITNSEISSADSIKGDFKVINDNKKVIFQVTEENDGMTLFIPPITNLNDHTNKLYNLNSVLHWNNIAISQNVSNNWTTNENNLILDSSIQNLGIGTKNPTHKLHIEEGSIFVKGSTNWFPGLVIENSNGRSVLKLQGNLNSENFMSSQIILADISNNSNWNIMNNSFNQLQFVSNDGNGEYRTPFEIDFSAPTNSLTINDRGNIGIGEWSTEHKLAVAGSVIAEEVVVKLQTDWPDYVFSEDYFLPNLMDVEQYIKTNKHLKGLPTAEDMKGQNINISEIQIKLLEKIEELTLYVIEQEKNIRDLEKSLRKYQQRIEISNE